MTNKDEQATPDLLYHYTSIEAFKSIIDSQRLRMTHYAMLNDHSELTLAIKMIREQVEQYKCENNHTDWKKHILDLLDSDQDWDIFITSFSEEADYLEQWRAYTPKGGVAIGFDFEVLNKGYLFDIIPEGELDIKRGIVSRYTRDGLTEKEKTNPDNLISGTRVKPVLNYDLLTCSYGTKENLETSSASKTARKVVEELFASPPNNDVLSKLKNPEDKLKPFEIMHRWVNNLKLFFPILRYAPTIKHYAYSGEKEWRWVNTAPDKKVFWRYLDNKNRTFVQARIDLSSIKEIWISPHGNAKMNPDMIYQIVRFYQYEHDLNYKIYKSKIPFRS